MYLYAIVQYLPDNHSTTGGTILSDGFCGGGRGCDKVKPTLSVDCFWEALDYFKRPDELLQSFVHWMARKSETGAYNQQNRLYDARYKYRFFKVDYDVLYEEFNKKYFETDDDPKLFLNTFEELSEAEFIYDMNDSEAMWAISDYFDNDKHLPQTRTRQYDTLVKVAYDKDNWCYVDSFLRGVPEGVETKTLNIPVDIPLKEVDNVISERLGRSFNFALQE